MGSSLSNDHEGSKKLILSPGDKIYGYRVEEILGSGGFGNVYKVVKGERTLALKRIAKSEQTEDSVKDEFKSLKIGAHTNVVVYIQGLIDSAAYNLFMEYCENGSIDNYLNITNCLGEEQRMGFIKNIVNGVAHLHDCGIIHRDLKPANILIDSQCVAKIADFGLAKVFNSEANVQKLYLYTEAGTVAYVAPEVIIYLEDIIADHYNIKADIFSMGLVFCSILNDDLKTQVEREMIGYKMKTEPEYKFKLPSTISPIMKRLIDRMLEKDYHNRPTARDIKGYINIVHTQDIMT